MTFKVRSFRISVPALAALATLSSVQVAACQSAAGPAAAPDSAAAELEAGRPWHAARLLEGHSPSDSSVEPETALLFARAAAAAHEWSRVTRLLEGATWLDEVEGGEGRRLLGRALEAEERWAEAADQYRRWLALPARSGQPDGSAAVLARLVRTAARADGGVDEAVASLGTLGAMSPVVAEWAALAAARPAAGSGDPDLVRALLAFVREPDVRLRAWALEPRALLAAGDSVAAETVLASRVADLPAGSRRGEARVLHGELLRAQGAEAEARQAFRMALADEPPAADAGRAARALLEMGALDASTALVVARALERAGDSERALRAYDLHVSEGGVAPASVRLARAGLMAQVPARHVEAVEAFTELSADPEVGAEALDQWMRLRERQGRSADAETLRNRLMERFPESPEAANALFLRGDAAHDERRMEEALRDYRRLVEAAPAQDRAGLARMRLGQIHLHRGEPREAAEVFEGYLEAFPSGRRWDEATYWAAYAHLRAGDEARARELLADLKAREPFGYYALLAADLLGEAFEIDLPEGEASTVPAWVREGMQQLELLDEAGLPEGVAWQIARLRSRAREAPAAEALALSEQLTAAGHSLDGINAASEVRSRGEPWTERLLRAVYPFPGRERIEREAAERGLDPLLVAALIRQESAWEEDIRSPVGATGLMQIMPETGRSLFRQHASGEYDAEMLAVGDLNLHLGTAYLVELLDRYDGDLPLALSGYNAGPHRADVWQDFPEAADPLQFTERIPYAETRDYVKRIRRNLAIYEALYGGGPRTR